MANRAFAESPKLIATLVAEIGQAESETRSDRDRDQTASFADLDISNASTEEYAQIASILRKSLADSRAVLRRPHPGLTEIERKAANEDLEKIAFKSDTRISDKKKREIGAYFRTHPSLDPRIIMVSYVDTTTIQIVSGVSTSWCATGLNFYVGRLENDRWVIRSGILAVNVR